MAWIESHQSLLNHGKTMRVVALLKVDRYKLIGHLQALWWWGLDNATDDGDLGDVTEGEIALAAGWPIVKATLFASVLETAHFLDKKHGRFYLHNWYRYAGKLNEKRAKDRARKAEVAGKSIGNPTEVAGKSQAPTNQPPQPTNQPNQPTLNGTRVAARDHVLNFTASEWRQLIRDFQGMNVQTLWHEWVSWIEEEEGGGRVPRSKLVAFRGWLRKKQKDTAAAS